MTELAVEAPVGAATDAPSTWQIEVDHSSYYRWIPVKDEEIAEGDLVIPATWPGFHQKRVLVDEPTTSTTGVHIASLASENTDRIAAGGSPKPLSALLTRHLEDGAWPKHFPMQSITAIRCSDPAIEAKLRSYFLEA